MKCHIGVDAGSRLVHTITVTAANALDITQAAALIREIENRKSSVRCKMEHAFRIIKCQFGYKKRCIVD